MSGGLLISGARIVDGTGAGSVPGFVFVDGDRIGRVGVAGEDEPADVELRVDAAGRVLCPGFIDVHNHSDLVPLVEPWMGSALRQGTTTVVVGNCGSSPWPPAGAPELATLIGVEPAELDLRWRSFGDYLDRIDACRPAVNVAALVGHGALRLQAMGMARRPPIPDELRSMRRMVCEAMADGALGLSTGLIYAPGLYSETDEVVALAGAVAPFGGIYASHIRGEGEFLFRAVDEAIEIGRRASIPAHVSHLKCETSLTWGRTDELLGRFRGSEDVTADQYPYAAWSSVLSSLLPDWAPVHGLGELIRDGERRARLAQVVEEGEPGWQSSIRGVGWNRIVIETTSEARWNGRSIADVAAARGVSAAEAAFDLLIEDPDTAVIGHAMHEDDVGAILAEPDIMVASDGSAMSPAGPLGRSPVHPRNYGTFPRVLGRYVREGVLGFEAAVRKMTSLPADRFGLHGRGRIREGAIADLVIVDPERVTDTSEFGAPHSFPEGIDLVVVAGRIAWNGGLGERAGRAIRRGDG